MASLSGVNQTLIDAGGIATIAQGLVGARVHCTFDSVAVTAAFTTADKIKLFGALPKGARVLEIFIESTVTQATCTINIGDASSGTRYGSAIVLTTGTTGTHAQVYSGLGYVIGTDTTTDDTQILLTVAGGGVTGATWYAWICYATD